MMVKGSDGPYGNSTGGIFGGFGPKRKPWENEPVNHNYNAMAAQPEQKPTRWLDGGKFKARDALALALGAIGDAFTGRPTTANMVAGNFAQRRAMQDRQQLMQQKRMADLEDYEAQKQIDQRYPTPQGLPSIALESVWFNSLPPEEQARVSSALDVLRPVMTTTWQGPQVVPRNSQAGPALNDIEAELKRRGVAF